MKQQTLAMAADQGAGLWTGRKRTRRDEFLDTMNTDHAVGRTVRGGRAVLSETRQRPPAESACCGFTHRFNLSDFACEEALYDSSSLRRFVGIDLGCEAVPDATTLLKSL